VTRVDNHLNKCIKSTEQAKKSYGFGPSKTFGLIKAKLNKGQQQKSCEAEKAQAWKYNLDKLHPILISQT
jgi:hypothetical protein